VPYKRVHTNETTALGAIFLDVAKALDTVWIDDLLYKLTS
jgi:hypothetical protein